MQNVMFLLRGVPGSGKSTVAEFLYSMALGNKEVLSVSADDFFTDSEGNYNFDPTRLRSAHEFCRKEVLDFMEYVAPSAGPSVVIVHNTFTQDWEMDAYFKLAKEHNFTVFSLVVENRHGNSNVHSVPDEKVRQMKNRFSIKL